MQPIRTENTNDNFGPPLGREGQIGDLPVQRVDHDDGTRTYYSTWELNDADRQAIANGLNLQLGVAWIGAFPPISLGVTHESRVGAPIRKPPPPIDASIRNRPAFPITRKPARRRPWSFARFWGWVSAEV